MLNRFMCVLIVMLLGSSAVLAQEEELSAGQLRWHGAAGNYQPAIQLRARVHLQVSGLVAVVRLEQQFRNDSNEWLEGEYLFPLPDQAAVRAMTLQIGERRIVGEIREKEQARKEYQAARDSGRKASLVEQRRPNMFSNRIANVAPGETVRVELEYVQMVRYQDNEFSLRFPMTLTPRYRADTDVWHFQNPVPATPQKPIQPIVVTANLDMGLPLARVESTYHPVKLSRERQRYRVELADGAVPMDRDFELRWVPQAGSEPQAALFDEVVGEYHYSLLMVLPPLPGKAAKLTRELVFVIDTSGSMGGSSINQARASLARALGQLEPGDSFNIIEFNSQARALFPEARPADGKHLALARRFVRHLDAGGGTEMLSALDLALPPKSGESTASEATGVPSPGVRQVVFITDGAVGNETDLFKKIEQRIENNRLFTVGIGSAPNSWFMRKAAEAGRGSFVFIADVLEVEEKMDSLFAQMSGVMMSGLELQWPQQVESYPARIPDLYPGEPLLITARTRGRFSDATVGVQGQGSDDRWQKQLTFSSQPSAHKGVASLWARRKIEALEDEKMLGRDPDSVRAEVLPLALEHRLLSPYTSFVAVEQRISREGDAPLHKKPVPNLRPHGQSPQPYAWPRTATGATQRALIGIALLGLALCASLRLRA